MDLSVKYLGLNLDNPIIVGSSSLTMSLDRIKQMEDGGAAAVVLKSIFEEQIMGEAGFLDRFRDYPEASDYLNKYLQDKYLDEHLKLIQDAKGSCNIPIIASINCQTPGAWIEYAKAIEAAGADAIELNIYIQPTSTKKAAEDIENQYLKVIGKVVDKVRIPVSVKLSKRFTNILAICRDIYFRRCRGVVMFNRYTEPDIDIDNLSFTSIESLSTHSEIRNSLRAVGLCAPQLPMFDIALSTGVHTGADVAKALLVGAKAVEVCSSIYLNGVGVIAEMKDFLEKWMEEHNFDTISDFNGRLGYDPKMNDQIYHRAQYMRYFPQEKDLVYK